MLVVKPWIFVESPPGATCQTLCDVPGFWFSRTIGFWLLGTVVAAAVLSVDVAVVSGAVMRAVVAGVTVFVVESNGRLMLLWTGGRPGGVSSKSKCELCATPLDLNRSPAACAGFKLSPTV